MQVKIRKFEPGDEQAVIGLIGGIMNQEFSHSKNVFPLDDLKNIPQIYGGSKEGFFVAVNSEHVIGTVAIKQEDEGVALLRRIFVAPECRKKKIGLALIDHAINFCREHGYREIVFKTCSKMDAAIQLCIKKSFHQRAKLEVNGLELLKLVLFLGENVCAQGKSI